MTRRDRDKSKADPIARAEVKSDIDRAERRMETVKKVEIFKRIGSGKVRSAKKDPTWHDMESAEVLVDPDQEYGCPECGDLIAIDDTNCKRCGAFLMGGVSEQAEGVTAQNRNQRHGGFNIWKFYRSRSSNGATSRARIVITLIILTLFGMALLVGVLAG